MKHIDNGPTASSQSASSEAITEETATPNPQKEWMSSLSSARALPLALAALVLLTPVNPLVLFAAADWACGGSTLEMSLWDRG